MRIDIKLLGSNKDISNSILKALLPQCSEYMESKISAIKNGISDITNKAIKSSVEYGSILNGQLKYELGIPDPATKLAGLLDIWSKDVKVQYAKPRIVNNQIKSSLSASTIRIDFADVLYTDYAIVQDGVRGYTLPWLQWLLLEGNRTIVKNYSVLMGANKFSRTGYAIMTDSRSSWRVPDQFSGTVNNNWITRAIDGVGGEVQDLLKRIIA